MSWLISFYNIIGCCGLWRLCQFCRIGQSIAEILWFFGLFFKMVATTILDLFVAHLDHPQRVLDGLYHCAKFGYDWWSSLDNMKVSIFGPFGYRTPIHASKLGFWDNLPSKWTAISTNAKKGTPLHEFTSSEPSSVKIWWAVCSVGESLEKGYKKIFWLYFTYFPEAPHCLISAKYCTAV